MNIIRFSVNHPVTTCMLMLALVMGGIFSLNRMEVELLPSISIPTLVVLTEVPKTSPEKVHKEVTLPLEESLNGVSNLVSLNSISLEGESRLILQLDWGTDVRAAEIEVRELVNALNLPDAASRPLIKKFDPSSAPVFRFDIVGGGLSTEDLRGLADDMIKPGLERLAGVGEVEVVGGTDPEYRVVGDRDKLAQYQLTVLSLIRAVSIESKNRKGGTIEIEDGKVASLRILGKANTEADLENLIVANPPGQSPIRIRDVAEVIRTNKETRSYARIDGSPSVGLSIKKSSDASVVTVVERIQKDLERLSPVLEKRGIEVQIAQDDSEYVISSQSLVISSIVQGGGLAGLLLFLFLRDLRAAVIVVLATPISMMSAAIFLNGFDISRNILTLGGLGLAVGLTLDSSIVLIESIYKQLSLGQNPKEAAIRGASEVAMGIFSSTMTSVAVFLPILFIPGLMQEVFKSLAHAIIWSVLMSMVVGIVFIPMVSARILSPKSADQKAATGWLGVVLRPFQKIEKAMCRWDRFSENSLSDLLKLLLQGRPLKIGILVFLIGISLLSLKFLPGRGFLPQGNVDELWIRFEAPAGVTLDYVDERLKRVEELLQTAPYRDFVKSVSADIRNDEGKLFVRLYPNREIEGGPKMRPPQWSSLSRCVQQIREGCDSIPDLKGKNFVSLVDKIRGGTTAPIVFKVYSRKPWSDLDESSQLKALQAEVEERILPVFKTIPSAIYQRIRINETPKEIEISTLPKRLELNEKGLTTRQISDTVRASVYGVKAATVLENGGETDVTVFLEDSNGESKGNFTPESLESLRVRSASTGLLHEIREVAVVNPSPGEGSIVLERTNRKPTVNLESHYAPYDVTGETIGDVTAQIEKALSLIPGFNDSFGYQIESEAKDTKESFSDAFFAFLISVALIYMIMCSQFEKFLDPLAIMVTVPLAAAGSVLMLNLTGELFSLGAFVGAVILCGVVVNNGIILVEYINILRQRGVERDDAIIQGSVRKLRSILITSTTSILGMVPLIFGVGEGTELYRGVAAVVVGGLIASTPLTLLALPILYSLLDELAEFSSSLGFRFSVAKDRMLGGNI